MSAHLPRTTPPLGFVVEELESRLLFSADVEAVLPGVGVLDPSSSASARAAVAWEQSAAVAVANSSEQHTQPTEIVFVDAGVDDAQKLVEQIRAQAVEGRQLQVVMLDAQRDAFEQIQEVLSQSGTVSAMHLITHGDGEGLQLGAWRLSTETLLDHADTIASWGNALAPDADLLLYGCDLASTEMGRALVAQLGELTGADVAASVDLTGHGDLGGNWTLEYRLGMIQSATLDGGQWRDVLATLSLQEGVNGYAGTVDTYISTSTGIADNTNRAESTTLAAGEDGTGGQARMFLKFDVSAIPVGSTINSVTLYLQITSAATFTNPTFEFHRILTSWSESDTWGTINGTFPESPNNVTVRSASDASLTESGAKNYTIASTTSLVNTVQGWVNNASTNHGWFTTNGGYQSRTSFASSENATVANRPKLVIDYTPPRRRRWTSTPTTVRAPAATITTGPTPKTRRRPSPTWPTPPSRPARARSLA